MNRGIIAATIATTLLLSACGESVSSISTTSGIVEPIPASTESTSQEASGGNSDSASETNASTQAGTESTANESQTTLPTKEEVAAAREKALTGMSQDEIDTLCSLIKGTDKDMEYKMIYENLLSRLSDPDDLAWNYFTETGDEVQIGWMVEGTPDSIKAAAEEEGVSLREYEAEHGEPAVTENDMDASDFADALESCKETVTNEALQNDLQRLADESRLIVETRDVSDVENAYHLLHDLDYWLLNYRLDTEGAYIEDKSTIGKYYGELSSY